MAKIVWSRSMTRDKLHESETKRQDLVDFYDYDELLETLDDEGIDDLIDSDDRLPAMDDAYYDEEVRPKIEAQTLDGIVLLVERPEEEEPEEEEPVEEEPIEEAMMTATQKEARKLDKFMIPTEYITKTGYTAYRKSDGSYKDPWARDRKVYKNTENGKYYVKYNGHWISLSDEEKKNMRKLGESKNINEAEENDLPELEGMAILADEIPEEFPDAKIVEEDGVFVLEDGDTKYDMYAIPEDKAEEFMEVCMEDPMGVVMDEDEEFESDLGLDVDSINDNCDFSKVPEVCEPITGDPVKEEEPEDEDEEELDEASVKPENASAIAAEAEELEEKSEEYGIEYFTAMPFSNYQNDPISFENQYPNVAKVWRSFFKEVLDIDPKDDDQIDEIWDTDIDQTDWNTVMKSVNKMASKASSGETGRTQLDKEFTAVKNADMQEESLKESLNEEDFFGAEDYFVDNDQPVKNIAKRNAQIIKSTLQKEWGEDYFDGIEITKEHGEIVVNTYNDLSSNQYICHSDGSISEVWTARDEVTMGVYREDYEEFDSIEDWLKNEDVDLDFPSRPAKEESIDEEVDMEKVDKPEESGDNWVKSINDLEEEVELPFEQSSFDEDWESSHSPEEEWGADGSDFGKSEAKSDIDRFFNKQDFKADWSDLEPGEFEGWDKEEWVEMAYDSNYEDEFGRLLDDWYSEYGTDSVEALENDAEAYFHNKCIKMLDQVWDSYHNNEDFTQEAPPSEESVDPDDGLTEAEGKGEWPWGDPGKLD